MERTYWYFSYTVNHLCEGSNVTWVDGPEFPLTREVSRACAKINGIAIMTFWRQISEEEFNAFSKYCREADGGRTVPPVVKLAAKTEPEPDDVTFPTSVRPPEYCRDMACPKRHPDNPA